MTHTAYQRGRRAGERGAPREVPGDILGVMVLTEPPQFPGAEWLEGYDSCFRGCDPKDDSHNPAESSASDMGNTILDRAKSIITGNRQTVNGKPERSFHKIAQRWSLTTGHPITAQQVALMMVDLKMVRALEGVTTEGQDDHFVDMAGYVALAAELGDK